MKTLNRIMEPLGAYRGRIYYMKQEFNNITARSLFTHIISITST